MSSTNNTLPEAQIGALFDALLLPMSERLGDGGMPAFPLAPDVMRLSYYVRRHRSAPIRADFVSASCSDVAELAQKLAEHWTALGRAELASQAGMFAELAGALRQARLASSSAGDQADVSPYVYAMF
ncbi:hypothetical protein [Massilia glaciei]|uniref:Uncharacterized protein n=1 Tax=Massilia glaciei TaxID=1524097 RepID=A0A2U2I7N6_9BURK|nr:hypothetical protein [Massilia glaciei]PWF55750.1 hypothetical protein C7C56_000235 [Massilia glaciei]